MQKSLFPLLNHFILLTAPRRSPRRDTLFWFLPMHRTSHKEELLRTALYPYLAVQPPPASVLFSPGQRRQVQPPSSRHLSATSAPPIPKESSPLAPLSIYALLPRLPAR